MDAGSPKQRPIMARVPVSLPESFGDDRQAGTSLNFGLTPRRCPSGVTYQLGVSYHMLCNDDQVICVLLCFCVPALKKEFVLGGLKFVLSYLQSNMLGLYIALFSGI